MTRRKLYVGVCFVFWLILRADAYAQLGWDYLEKSPEPIIGLLNLPEIVGEACDDPKPRTSARAFATPSKSGTTVGTIYLRNEGHAGCWLTIAHVDGIAEDIPFLESGYEVAAAIVYERRGNWFRIALKRGSAWMQRDSSRGYLAYPQMLGQHLGYIQSGWDGILRATPGRSGPVMNMPGGAELDPNQQIGIEYLESRRIGNELWLRVRLVKDRCSNTVEGVPVMTGWILARRPNGSPSAWFLSRGC